MGWCRSADARAQWDRVVVAPQCFVTAWTAFSAAAGNEFQPAFCVRVLDFTAARLRGADWNLSGVSPAGAHADVGDGANRAGSRARLLGADAADRDERGSGARYCPRCGVGRQANRAVPANVRSLAGRAADVAYPVANADRRHCYRLR